MLDFIADTDKAKRIAYKYGLRLSGDFELKKLSFLDKTLSDGIFWTYSASHSAALISVYGYLKIVDSRKISAIETVVQGQKYPISGSCFRIIRDSKGHLALVPASAYSESATIFA